MPLVVSRPGFEMQNPRGSSVLTAVRRQDSSLECSEVPCNPQIFLFNVKYLCIFTFNFHLLNDRHWDTKNK